jgi:hypothetical protein
VAEGGTNVVLAGLRFYFGQRDKTLIARNRQDDPAGLPGDGGCTGDVFFNSGSGNIGLLNSGNVNTVVANSGSNDVGFAASATRP